MKKVIFLIDMNSFFISCETARNSYLKGKPAAVAGDPKNRSGIILTANYEARKYNIKTTMTIYEAKKLCPGIILVPPDKDYYKKKSKEVMSILSEFSPTIQQNSIDEAWIDMTGTETLFGEPVEAAGKIMKCIMDKLDLMCSIGISENKFLAKMASEIKKPMGITEIWKKDVEKKIWPLNLERMYGVGNQTARKLNNIGVFTIGDLALTDVRLLNNMLGKYGVDLYNLSHGIDSSDITPNPDIENRSINRSTTLSRDINDLEYAKKTLLILAEEIGNEARRGGYSGKTISISIKFSDFSSISRQIKVQPTNLTKEIYRFGVQLLKENWNINRPVRLLGVTLGDLEQANAAQTSFEGFERGSMEKEEKIEKTMDRIREKYGFDILKRAKSIENKDENKK